MTLPSATASVEVSVDPLTAFRAFTDEIDAWWVRGPINFFDGARAVAMRIEPGVGGRVLEIYSDAMSRTPDALELARITVWEPGTRVVFRGTVDETEVDVRFEPSPGGSRVTVHQYLRPDGDPKRAFLFWPRIIWMFDAWCDRRDTEPHHASDVAPVHVALYYRDPPAAARWLARVFGIRTVNGKLPDEGERPTWLELRVGDVPIVLSQLEGNLPAESPITNSVWVHVADLDAHFARARDAGATIVSEVRQYGYRFYVADDLEKHRWTFVQARPTMRGAIG
jgi:uncharacterized glyoxalase superfamily protein PhnB